MNGVDAGAGNRIRNRQRVAQHRRERDVLCEREETRADALPGRAGAVDGKAAAAADGVVAGYRTALDRQRSAGCNENAAAKSCTAAATAGLRSIATIATRSGTVAPTGTEAWKMNEFNALNGRAGSR